MIVYANEFSLGCVLSPPSPPPLPFGGWKWMCNAINLISLNLIRFDWGKQINFGCFGWSRYRQVNIILRIKGQLIESRRSENSHDAKPKRNKNKKMKQTEKEWEWVCVKRKWEWDGKQHQEKNFFRNKNQNKMKSNKAFLSLYASVRTWSVVFVCEERKTEKTSRLNRCC